MSAINPEPLQFVINTQIELFTIQRSLGLESKYRTKPCFINYRNYLTPPLTILAKETPDLYARIGSKALFSLKEFEKILERYKKMYKDAFEFDR